MASLAILACTKSKRICSSSRADLLYTGPIFQRLFPIVKKDFDHILILSAKYGVVLPETKIKPYFISISSQGVAKDSNTYVLSNSEVIAWKERVCIEMKRFIKKHGISRLVYFCSQVYWDGLPIGETPFKGVRFFSQMRYVSKLKKEGGNKYE